MYNCTCTNLLNEHFKKYICKRVLLITVFNMLWQVLKLYSKPNVKKITDIIKGAQSWDIRLWGFYTNQACMGVGDLGTRPKNSKGLWFWLVKSSFFYYLALSLTALKISPMKR